MSRSRLIFLLGLAILGNVALADSPLQAMQYVRGEPVFSSPYLGERSAFEAYDLITAISSQNQPLRLLEQMQKAEARLSSKGYTMPSQPTIDLSGQVTVLGELNQGYGKSKFNDSFDLSSVELDVFARINNWALAFINMVYDSDPLPAAGFSKKLPIRNIDNSRFYLDQGFIAFGNLNKTPVYLVAGQVHVPFGEGSSGLVSGNVTKSFTDTVQRAVMLGAKQDIGNFSYNVVVYGFNSNLKNNSNDGGAKIAISFVHGQVSGSLSGGVISNILEAKVFQKGGGQFKGLSFVKKTSSISSRQIGWTGRAKIAVSDISLSGEFVALNKSLPVAFFNDGVGGKLCPYAWYAEISGEHKIKGIPTQLTIGYSKTHDAFVLGKPEHKIAAAVTIQPIKSTLLAVEFARSRDYSKNTQASSYDVFNNVLTVPSNASGKWKSEISMFLGYYF